MSILPGSARVPRPGVGVPPTRTFLAASDPYSSGCPNERLFRRDAENQHARRVRYLA